MSEVILNVVDELSRGEGVPIYIYIYVYINQLLILGLVRGGGGQWNCVIFLFLDYKSKVISEWELWWKDSFI